MNVSLTPELEKFIADKVSTGLYGSASEVVREALRLLRERDEVRRHRLAELNRDIEFGLAELDRGEGLPAEQVFAELLRPDHNQAS